MDTILRSPSEPDFLRRAVSLIDLLVDLYLDERDRTQALSKVKILAAEFPANAGTIKDLKKLNASV
jgi:hypothetical protein